MDWIFEHPQVLILLGGAIFYWISQWKRAREEEKEAQTERSAVPAPSTDPEAERVRRIQEEIRRKIQQRAGGGTGRVPPPLPVPQPAPQVVPAVEETTEPEPGVDPAVLERQQQLAAKMAELEEVRRRAGQRKAERFAETTTAALEDSAARGSLLADLQDPASARRAMVLREVL